MSLVESWRYLLRPVLDPDAVSHRSRLWAVSCVVLPHLRDHPITLQAFQASKEYCTGATDSPLSSADIAQARAGLEGTRALGNGFAHSHTRFQLQVAYLALINFGLEPTRPFLHRASYLLSTACFLMRSQTFAREHVRRKRLLSAVRYHIDPLPVPVGEQAHPAVDWVLERSGGDPGRLGSTADALQRLSGVQPDLDWFNPVHRFLAERCEEFPQQFREVL